MDRTHRPTAAEKREVSEIRERGELWRPDLLEGLEVALGKRPAPVVELAEIEDDGGRRGA